MGDTWIRKAGAGGADAWSQGSWRREAGTPRSPGRGGIGCFDTWVSAFWDGSWGPGLRGSDSPVGEANYELWHLGSRETQRLSS